MAEEVSTSSVCVMNVTVTVVDFRNLIVPVGELLKKKIGRQVESRLKIDALYHPFLETLGSI